jgi:hypothetical protein
MKHFYALILFSIFAFSANSQCENFSEYGLVSAPTSGSITISTCSYQTEYSVIENVLAATIYQCEIVNGGYITIREGASNGPVVASGASPLNWTSTTAGTYYAHWNTDASCGTATNCETTIVTYVSPAFPCSGVPAPGNTLCSAGNSVCPNASINLTLQNPMLGSGITYQWYSSTDGVNYSPIVGANAATYSTSISVPTYFYCSEDCAGSTTNSTPISLTIAPFNQCYCTPLYFTGTDSGDLISNVEIEGTTLANNTGFVAGGPSYTFFTGQPNYTATLIPSNSYNLNISTGEWGSQGYAAWIDYNDDGIFDLTERIGYTIGTIGNGFTDGQVNASSSFTISLACTPPVGSHRLRIRGAYFVNGDLIDPCLEYSYGETEDYQITIAAPPACPSAGLMTSYTSTQTTATVNWALNCSSASVFNIEYGPQGFTPGTGTLLANQTVTVVNDTASFSFTGLTATTNYDFYYQAVCGGTTSSWSATSTFTTACGSIAALGWCEGFDNTSSSEQCWSVLNVNNDFSSWDTNTDFNQLNGDNCASISTDFNAGANDDWLISPQLVLTGSELLSFHYRVISEFEPNDLKVKISTTGNAPADFTTTLLSLDSIANTVYADTSVNLSAYTGSVYIAFHIPPGGLDGWILYLDQICVGSCSSSTISDDSVQVCASSNTLDLSTVLNIGQSIGTWNLPNNQNAIDGEILLLDSIAEGTYAIQFLVNNVCQSASAIATVELFAESNAGIDSSVILCKGEPFDLFNSLGGDFQTGGVWYDPSNQQLQSSSIVTGNFPGQYNYDYIVANGVCPSDTSNALIIVNDCVWVGLEDLSSTGIKLYPNPTEGVLNVSIENPSSSYRIEITDINGRLIFSDGAKNAQNGLIAINVEKLVPGMYYLNLIDSSKRKVVSFIKK